LNLTNQHKALLITLLIAGSVVLSVFNLSLKQQNELASESYYEIEPEKELTEEELKILEALDQLSNSKAETNKAFNESEKSNHFAQAFKPIAPPEDYVPKEINHSDNANNLIKNYDSTDDSKLNQEELSKFSKVNDLIKKQQSDGNNSKSSISFSLVNRKKVHIPIPIYLCEVDGKIVVNINVDANGNVTDAYLNTSSKSDNACLIEHALQYAKQSQFSADVSKENQIGSITFFFIGKR
jgi:outer membrane biosynthesis protein TonB